MKFSTMLIALLTAGVLTGCGSSPAEPDTISFSVRLHRMLDCLHLDSMRVVVDSGWLAEDAQRDTVVSALKTVSYTGNLEDRYSVSVYRHPSGELIGSRSGKLFRSYYDDYLEEFVSRTDFLFDCN